MANNNRKVCWGIAGLGKVALRFASDLTKQVDNAVLCAVAARHADRAASFGSTFQIDRTYGTYLDLAKDPDVDIVYVSSIHPFHKEMVKLFLSHGKHVLVEKPAFTNVEDWDQMFSLATDKGLLLIEAMKTLAFPAYQTLRQFIKDNAIIIDNVEASFGNQHNYESNAQLFSSTLSGGSTLDAGVYAIWLYTDLCRLMNVDIPEPELVRFIPDSLKSDVDVNMELFFTGPINAKIMASITQNLPREAVISGPHFNAVIKDKWWNPKEIDISFNGVRHAISAPCIGGGFEYEIEHVSSLIIQGKIHSDIMPFDYSRKVISIMESSLKKGGFNHLV
jgi:predicted dehydrogenase